MKLTKKGKEYLAAKKKEKIKVVWRQDKTGTEEVFRGASIRVNIREDYSSYQSNLIEIAIGEEGSIHFSDDVAESSIYFYPDQLEHLERALRIAKKQVKNFKKEKIK